MSADVPAAPNPTTAALLEQMRDIELPAPVSIWPPAPGWWILALFAAASIFAVSRWIQKWRAVNRDRDEAQSILEALYIGWQSDRDDLAFVSEVHRLIRRVTVARAGRESVARLTGRAFIDRANALSKAPISQDTATWIVEAVYRADSERPIPVDTIRREVEAWLAELERPSRA